MSSQVSSSQHDPFLIQSEPWVVYRTLLDLCGLPPDDPEVLDARSRMLTHPLVSGIMAELQDWPGQVLNSHKSAGQLYHKLAFMAELGMTRSDPGMAVVISKMMAHRSEEGFIQLSTRIPVHFGGSGEETWAWALCDAPTSIYALTRLGLKDDPSIQEAVTRLAAMGRNNGWPCTVSKELGTFRGPGKKSDPCPYATLIMLKLLAQFDSHQQSDAAIAGIESLLNLWEKSREQHPYMFFMGTDFRKLKAPFIWYDLLHVTEVLSQFPSARLDYRLRDMLDLIRSKADANGQYTPESIWQAWQGWDFGQKKIPSAWLTFLVRRIEKRFTHE